MESMLNPAGCNSWVETNVCRFDSQLSHIPLYISYCHQVLVTVTRYWCASVVRNHSDITLTVYTVYASPFLVHLLPLAMQMRESFSDYKHSGIRITINLPYMVSYFQCLFSERVKSGYCPAKTGLLGACAPLCTYD